MRVSIEQKNTMRLGALLDKLSLTFHHKMGMPIPYFFRMLVDFTQAENPLGDSDDSPEIEVLIPCTTKDFEILPYSLKSVLENSLNPISKVVLVTPEKFLVEAKQRFPDLIVTTDEQVLGIQVIEQVVKSVPLSRRGWTLQQLIKMSYSRNSKAAGVLLWDADTILAKPTTWINSAETQILMFSHEYHLPYVRNAENYWEVAGKSRGMSFVTHHQLMQPQVLKEMFPRGKQSIIEWIESCDWSTGSAFSEYHSYGTWISNRYPQQVIIGVWGNQSDTRSNFLKGISLYKSVENWSSTKHPGARSISLHDYLN